MEKKGEECGKKGCRGIWLRRSETNCCLYTDESGSFSDTTQISITKSEAKYSPPPKKKTKKNKKKNKKTKTKTTPPKKNKTNKQTKKQLKKKNPTKTPLPLKKNETEPN